jgi:hypothetical protein
MIMPAYRLIGPSTPPVVLEPPGTLEITAASRTPGLSHTRVVREQLESSVIVHSAKPTMRS